MSEHGYIYVIVRTDLSAPQRAVQSCHAVIEMMRENEIVGDHPSVIICGVSSETKLLNAMDRLYNEGIYYKEFREPDIGDELTAIATRPLYGDERRFFKKYQLIR
jgi:hypothetical protein